MCTPTHQHVHAPNSGNSQFHFFKSSRTLEFFIVSARNHLISCHRPTDAITESAPLVYHRQAGSGPATRARPSESGTLCTPHLSVRTLRMSVCTLQLSMCTLPGEHIPASRCAHVCAQLTPTHQHVHAEVERVHTSFEHVHTPVEHVHAYRLVCAW